MKSPDPAKMETSEEIASKVDGSTATTASSKASSKAERLPAIIDYRLRARAVVQDYRRGGIYKSQICDAHPELLRVAHGVGEPTDVECPVCAEENLVKVRYLFGEGMGPSGRCMADLAELMRFTRNRRGIFTCYVIEVCTGCHWNFLAQSIPVRGGF